MTDWLAPAAPALVVAAGLTWLVALVVCEWARRRRILDVPNERSSHVRPTPRLGGIGIVCGVFAGCLVPLGAPVDYRRVGLVLLVAGLLAAASLLDDLRGLSARLRLALHVAAAAATIWGLAVVPRAQAAGLSDVLGWAFGVLAVLWVVAFVNAFNFMDGIDGIAAGQALVAGLGWLVVGISAGDAPVVRLAASVAGASAGFLVLNWSPARLFMGDVGSAFLGYLLAALPLVGANPVTLAGPALVLVWPFLFDTAFTLIRRARRGEDLFQAHRTHLYQRLTQAAPRGGASAAHASVAATYIGLAAAGMPTAWALATGRWWAGAAGLAVAGGLALALWRQVVVREAAGPL